ATPAEREGSVALNTWEEPSPALPTTASSETFPPLEGCEALRFGAGLQVTPETSQADAPSSYEVGLEVPQAPNTFSSLATPPVKDISVTLPAGTAVSPPSSNGQVACQETGPRGINVEGSESEEEAADGLTRPAPGHCPVASQIASVTATTPLLAGEEQLKGHLFLA